MQPIPEEASSLSRAWKWIVGRPRSLADNRIFHQLSLIPFLAWVGLGADGLSSSAYGPPESFAALGEHRWLALALATMTAVTVLIISMAYTRIIAAFPNGGGGYVVATRLLGPVPGVVSGSALLVDYMLTVTVSIAAAGDALFSFLPVGALVFKLAFEIFILTGMILLNLRGVREAILPLVPVFLLFLVTHIVLIAAGLFSPHTTAPIVSQVTVGFHTSYTKLGMLGMFLLFARAWSLGGGTYTGIEAVSNGLPILREPRAKTARITMTYMAASLALTAAGLLICYLLADVHPVDGQTLNAILAERVSQGWPGGKMFSVVTLIAEGALLVVGAQAGFLDGPRVLSNMALDGWAPRRFAALSQQLTTQNGIMLIGGASLLALWYTKGDVGQLVVMYSINVFLTFSLSMLGMLRKSIRKKSFSDILLFTIAFVLCASILCVTAFEKFLDGGWITLVVTFGLVMLFVAIRSHYRAVANQLPSLDADLPQIELPEVVTHSVLDPSSATAAILVGGYNGVGHQTLNVIQQTFPGHYKNVVFIAVGTVDSATIKDEHELQVLRARTHESTQRYVLLGQSLGLNATGMDCVGTDPVQELEKLCLIAATVYPSITFFAGQIIFGKEKWWHTFLHNHTADGLQKRLQVDGHTMVILPVRLH
ncbi:MAG: amino acid permease [Candidatus Uhrbacteria bacterium]|nr:amino acid permease [Candidatus Uhrbacteria bacterium]